MTYLITVGSEVEVVPDMLLTGAFAHVNAIMFNWSIPEIHRSRIFPLRPKPKLRPKLVPKLLPNKEASFIT